MFANLGRALAVAGARPEHVTKLTIFVVNYNRECLPVRVAAPARPDHLIEMDAIAVI